MNMRQKMKRQEIDNLQFLIKLAIVRNVSARFFCILWITDSTAINEQFSFFGKQSILKGLRLTSKAASGRFREVVWYWIKENFPRLEKVHPDTHNKRFT